MWDYSVRCEATHTLTVNTDVHVWPFWDLHTMLACYYELTYTHLATVSAMMSAPQQRERRLARRTLRHLRVRHPARRL